MARHGSHICQAHLRRSSLRGSSRLDELNTKKRKSQFMKKTFCKIVVCMGLYGVCTEQYGVFNLFLRVCYGSKFESPFFLARIRCCGRKRKKHIFLVLTGFSQVLVA